MPSLNQKLNHVASSCIAYRVRLLNRAITSIYDEALRPLGLKVSQLNLLIVTHKLGIARPAEACRILQMDTSTLSRNVERMRERGWLETVSESDARAHPFRLTEAGRELLAQAYPQWEQAQQQAAELLGSEAVAALDRSATALRLADSPSAET